MGTMSGPYWQQEAPGTSHSSSDRGSEDASSGYPCLFVIQPSVPRSFDPCTYSLPGTSSSVSALISGSTRLSHDSANTRQGLSGTKVQSFIGAGSPFSIASPDGSVVQLEEVPRGDIALVSQAHSVFAPQKLSSTNARPVSHEIASWQPLLSGMDYVPQQLPYNLGALGATDFWKSGDNLLSTDGNNGRREHDRYTEHAHQLQLSPHCFDLETLLPDDHPQSILPGPNQQLIGPTQSWPVPATTYSRGEFEYFADAGGPLPWPNTTYDNTMLIHNAYLCQRHEVPDISELSSGTTSRQPDKGAYPRAHHTGKQITRRVPSAQVSPVYIAPKSADGKIPNSEDKHRAYLDIRATRRAQPQPGRLRRAGHVKSKKACWICVLQKDPCEMGEHGNCRRCAARLNRGQPNILGCVRTHLREMQMTLLPESMTQMHERDGLIQYVGQRATRWRNPSRGIEAFLNTGFGPSFKWTLHEFEPAWPGLLSRIERVEQVFIEDGITKIRSTPVQTPSPPLGLQRLNESDGEYLNKVMDDMIVKHLPDFQKKCFNVKADRFRREVTSLLCTLYMSLSHSSTDSIVRKDLQGVLKMLAVTLIMGHTIDLDPRHRDTVLKQLSKRQNLTEYPKETSPWMVSMQLKYFFSEIRKTLYADNLERLNNILHSAKSANPRLSALVYVLGFALALEECQYTIWLQAEGRVQREEEEQWSSWKKARTQCDNIDTAFEFIRNLFHCRYTVGKNKQRADLNDWVDKSQSPAEKHFLVNLFALYVKNRDYLEQRKDLCLGSPADSNHSARFLSRFMLGVM